VSHTGRSFFDECLRAIAEFAYTSAASVDIYCGVNCGVDNRTRRFLVDVTREWTDCPNSVGRSEPEGEIDFPTSFGISNWARVLDSVSHVGITTAWCEEGARQTSADVELENIRYQ
jgi:hypothetical protein